jgi:diguanylate cyclase (GGDEF)-like protein/PAS domain S-box-containing protein
MLIKEAKKTIKILIVEDEVIIAEDIKDILETRGYSIVDIAISGEEAIDRAFSLKPDLVMMDICLKGKLDGISAAQEIWQRLNIPIVFLTANSDFSTIERAKDTEPFGYITKPFKEKDLHIAIEIALHRHQLEQKLKAREQWLDTILFSLGDAAIATDENNRITFLNPAAETLTGWKASEACGKKVTEVFQPIQEETRQNLASKVIVAKNGKEIAIDEVSTPLQDKEGEIIGSVVVFRDVSDRQRDQERSQYHHAITRILAEAESIEKAIPETIEQICRGFNWVFGAFWLLDAKENVLCYVDDAQQPNPDILKFEALAKQLIFSKRTDVPESNSGKPIWSPLGNPTLDLKEHKKLRSAYGIPIVSNDKSLGVMTFFSDRLQRPDTALLEMLETIGRQIGEFIERKRAEAALKDSERLLSWEAKHDALTGLVNRREFERYLEKALLAAKETKKQHYLCYIDLDRFKIVNDTCGHAAGDELLRQITTVLRSQVRASDILARLGGDEFALLLENCPLDRAMAIADAMRLDLQELQFVCCDKTFTVGASVGVVAIDAKTLDIASALNAADAACYAAKNSGRNRVHLYRQSDREVIQQHGQIQWCERLTKALEEDRFYLYWQPIASLKENNEIEHAEILLRLRDEETGTLISPMAFIPAAERYNLMPKIDRWVIKTLFAALAKKEQGDRVYTINLSSASLYDEQFIEFLREQLSNYNISPRSICFELSENVAINHLSQLKSAIEAFKQLGCRFALDNFGRGISSFAYLKNLSVDYLKIDGELIKDIVDDATDLALTEAINHIGQMMGMQTIAEYVENDEILSKLKAIGVDYAQGYGIAKPRPFIVC